MVEKIQSATKPFTFTCARCGKPLLNPVEETSVYVFEVEDVHEIDPKLICVGCVKSTDRYIWGTKEVLA
jgi:hypothetical protein